MDIDNSTVDVVIPTRDRPAQLAACLASLQQQNFQDFGVIVVDDGGRPAAETLIPDDVREALTIQFVRNPVSAGAGASRNRGAAVSRADFLIFLDDDCIADADLVGRHLAALASATDPTVSLGPMLSVPGQRLPVWSRWDSESQEREYRRLAYGAGMPGYRNLFTGNVAVRRADFQAVGGFDESFSRQEDLELGYRLSNFGCRFQFDNGTIVWHDSRRSLAAWRRIAAACASGDMQMDRLFPESDRFASHRNKRRALRLLRGVARLPVLERWAISGSIGLGRVLYAMRADRLAMVPFSVAYDLSYCRALREAASATYERTAV